MKRIILIQLFLLLGILWSASFISAQGACDIYLVKMSRTEGKVVFGSPLKITIHKGYNNQPYFMPDSSMLLYSSQVGKQTDIYRYDLKSRKTTQLTSTPESEYSPTPMRDGKHFSVIQQINTDGPQKGAQKLMAFPLEARGKPYTLFYQAEKLVGYHAWLDKQHVAMFILGTAAKDDTPATPHTLQIVDLKTGKCRIAAADIGASLYKIPGKNAVSFTHYKGNKDGVIKSVDIDTLKITPLVPMKKGNGYYTITAAGELLMAVGTRIFKYIPGQGSSWIQAADFKKSGIKKITRLAVDAQSQWLAVVSNH